MMDRKPVQKNVEFYSKNKFEVWNWVPSWSR